MKIMWYKGKFKKKKTFLGPPNGAQMPQIDIKKKM